MRTRIVRVRRERPSGLIWALSLMLLSLAVYLLTSAPPVKSALSANPITGDTQAVPDKVETAPRVTKEIVFGPVDYFLIQFGAYTDAENARIEAARYVKRGAAGYVLEDEMYRVIGAGYHDKTEAEKVKDKLYEQEAMNCIVYAIHAGQVTLRVTATENQIAALTNTQQLFDEQVVTLGQLAFQIDGGEINAQAAKASLQTMQSEIGAARANLAYQAGENANNVAAGLIELAQSLEDALNTLGGDDAQSLLSFSSKIKYNTIDLRLKHAEYLKKLAG